MAKRHNKNLELVTVGKRYTVDEALDIIEKFSAPKFDETVNVAFRLGIDVKQADQQVRGATVLPNGVGNKVRVLVFARGAKATEATEAGADFVGAEDLVEKISGGWMDFDKVIATPDMMAAIAKVARILGPRGLMPNPKTGTVTMDVKKAVGDERKGKVEFRAEKSGIVHSPIGKRSFGKQKLKENFLALNDIIVRMKPATAKGSYLKSVTVHAAMSPGLKLDTNLLMSSSSAE